MERPSTTRQNHDFFKRWAQGNFKDVFLISPLKNSCEN